MATRLPVDFDPVLLQADLETCDEFAWVSHGAGATVGWSCLALRAHDGRVNDPTQGPAGAARWRDTPLLARCSYFRFVLGALAERYTLASVRVSALEPQGRVAEHTDETAPMRIHVPIVTNPEAVLELDGVEHRWQAGEAWLGDFSRPHRAWNGGATRRVHLLAVVR